MQVAALAAFGAGQLAANVAVILKNIEMPPLQSFGVIVTKDLTTVLGTAQLCPQTGCFFNLKKDAMVFIEAAIGDRPLVAQAQHLVEQFFGCHPRQRYTPIPPKSARNPGARKRTSASPQEKRIQKHSVPRAL